LILARYGDEPAVLVEQTDVRFAVRGSSVGRRRGDQRGQERRSRVGENVRQVSADGLARDHRVRVIQRVRRDHFEHPDARRASVVFRGCAVFRFSNKRKQKNRQRLSVYPTPLSFIWTSGRFSFNASCSTPSPMTTSIHTPSTPLTRPNRPSLFPRDLSTTDVTPRAYPSTFLSPVVVPHVRLSVLAGAILVFANRTTWSGTLSWNSTFGLVGITFIAQNA